jgi:hypothetical protein
MAPTAITAATAPGHKKPSNHRVMPTMRAMSRPATEPTTAKHQTNHLSLVGRKRVFEFEGRVPGRARHELALCSQMRSCCQRAG